MAKKGPLGKAEAFYVEEKYKNGIEVQEIAHELDRAVSAIQKHVDDNGITVKSETIMQQQFAKQKGSIVMTENASSMIDAKRGKTKTLNPNCITKIK